MMTAEQHELSERVRLAHETDPKLAARAEGRAVEAIGCEFGVRKNGNCLRGTVTHCEFAGFAGSSERYRAHWNVTVTHPKGASLTICTDRLPRS